MSEYINWMPDPKYFKMEDDLGAIPHNVIKYNMGFIPAMFKPGRMASSKPGEKVALSWRDRDPRGTFYTPTSNPESVFNAVVDAVLMNRSYTSARKGHWWHQCTSAPGGSIYASILAYLAMATDNQGRIVNIGEDGDASGRNSVWRDYRHRVYNELMSTNATLPEGVVAGLHNRAFPLFLHYIVPYMVRGLTPWETSDVSRNTLNKRKVLNYEVEYRAFDIPAAHKVCGPHFLGRIIADPEAPKMLGTYLQLVFGSENVKFMQGVLLNSLHCPDKLDIQSYGISTTSFESEIGFPPINTITRLGDSSGVHGYDSHPWTFGALNNKFYGGNGIHDFNNLESPGVYKSGANAGVKFNALRGFARTHSHQAQPITKYNSIANVEYLGMAALLRVLHKFGGIPDDDKNNPITFLKNIFEGMVWYSDMPAGSVIEYIQRYRLRIQYIMMYTEIFNEMPPREVLDKMQLKSALNTLSRLNAFRGIFSQRWPHAYKYCMGLFNRHNRRGIGISNTELATTYIHIICALQFETDPKLISVLLNKLVYNATLCMSNESLCKLSDIWKWLKISPYWCIDIQKATMDRVKNLCKADANIGSYDVTMWGTGKLRKIYRYFVAHPPQGEDTNRLKKHKDTLARIRRATRGAINNVQGMSRRAINVTKRLKQIDLRAKDDRTVWLDDKELTPNEDKELFAQLKTMFPWLHELADKGWVDVHVGLLASKVVATYPRFTPYYTLLLMAENPRDIQSLAMVNALWSGNDRRLRSAWDINRGIMGYSVSSGSFIPDYMPKLNLFSLVEPGPHAISLVGPHKKEQFAYDFATFERAANDILNKYNEVALMTPVLEMVLYEHFDTQTFKDPREYGSAIHAVNKVMLESLTKEETLLFCNADSNTASPVAYLNTRGQIAFDRASMCSGMQGPVIAFFDDMDNQLAKYSTSEVAIRRRLRSCQGIFPDVERLVSALSEYHTV